MTPRRIRTWFLALLLLSAPACGNDDNRLTAEGEPATTTTEAEEEREEEAEEEEEPDVTTTTTSEPEEKEDGEGDAEEEEAAAPDAVTVEAKSLAFKPKDVKVARGGTVTWVMDDGATPHNVKATGKGDFESDPSMTEGEEYSYTFKTAGTYEYECTLHPGMEGKVRVV